MNRAVAVSLLALSGCRPAAAPAVAENCAPADRLCREVWQRLEGTRPSLGWERGSGREWAEDALFELGPRAAPYLEEALDDPERFVRLESVGALVAFGRLETIDRWCAGGRGDADLCGGRRPSADRKEWCGLGTSDGDECFPFNRLRALDTWRQRYSLLPRKLRGTFRSRGGDDPPAVELRLALASESDDELCLRGECRPVTEVTLSGEWLEIRYGVEERQVFHFSGDWLTGRMPGEAFQRVALERERGGS